MSTEYAIQNLEPVVLRDTCALFCGTVLGFGVSRIVYEFLPDPSKVVKIETAAQSFQNALEWTTWEQLRDTKFEQYLAPCHSISPCGIAMVQTKVAPLPPDDDPLMKDLRMPAFLTDFKRANYGLLDGRIVAADYGSNLSINHGAFASRMRRVKWRGPYLGE